jgi:glycosyltransferase involved in cell wall biosynthesis
VNIQLSVVIISYNEEKNIARCLESVQGIADEILLVDSFSKDLTRDIATSMGARVIEHVFEGHIQQKNYAAQQAKYDCILSLDADEALSDELKKSIQQIKSNWQYDAYQMNRCTNYCGKWIKHSGWYPDRKLRLWNRTKGEWGGVNPHDKWELHNKSMNFKWIKGDILHYSYYSIEEHWKQAEKFSNIAAQAMFDQGKRISFAGVYLKAAFKFIRNYFLKAGFLDGYYGWVVCKITAWETFEKYRKLRDMNRRLA